MTYLLGEPAPVCSTTDALSGVAVPATVSLSSGTVVVGALTATCSGAVDKAGNAWPPTSVTYLIWAAFGRLISALQKSQVGKSGLTIPITFVLVDFQGHR